MGYIGQFLQATYHIGNNHKLNTTICVCNVMKMICVVATIILSAGIERLYIKLVLVIIKLGL